MNFFTKHFPQLLILIFLLNYTSLSAKIIYVKSDATGNNDGSTWTNAFKNLQDAIDGASSDDMIWIAAGSYMPTKKHKGTLERNKNFYISKNISLVGGFAGNPGTEGDLQSRDWIKNISILSGDLGAPNDASDNAFHVLYLDLLLPTVAIDGLIIENGNSINASGLDGYGAGIFVNAENGVSNPTLRNCIIRNNKSLESGGGLFIYAENGSSSMMIDHCAFQSNEANSGGGIALLVENNGEGSPLITSCTIQGNASISSQGGAISFIAHSAISAPRIVNCLITGNHSPASQAIALFTTGTGVLKPEFLNSTICSNTGGAINVSDFAENKSTVKIKNCILYQNPNKHGLFIGGLTKDVTFSVMQSGFDGDGNLNVDPAFFDMPSANGAHINGDFHLKFESPAIDAGSNDETPVFIAKDIEGNPRFINVNTGAIGRVDIGAYETKKNTTSIIDQNNMDEVIVYPNPASNQINVIFSDQSKSHLISIYSSDGKLIEAYETKIGVNSINLDIQNIPSGIYFVTINSDKYQKIKKITVQK